MELCGKKKKRIPEQSGVAGGGVGGGPLPCGSFCHNIIDDIVF